MPFKSDKQKRFMFENLPKIAKRWAKKYQQGGKLKGPSHKQGGIPIEAEGGEYIVRKSSVNPKTRAVLEYINKKGKLPKKKHGGLITDARKRRK